MVRIKNSNRDKQWWTAKDSGGRRRTHENFLAVHGPVMRACLPGLQLVLLAPIRARVGSRPPCGLNSDLQPAQPPLEPSQALAQVRQACSYDGQLVTAKVPRRPGDRV
jgi:hypothetical protein